MAGEADGSGCAVDAGDKLGRLRMRMVGWYAVGGSEGAVSGRLRINVDRGGGRCRGWLFVEIPIIVGEPHVRR
jgi:hypothetical protein